MPYLYSISSDVHNEIKIKRSRFIAHLHYCETLISAKEFITEISKEYHTANHNCWAYIVGNKAENEHCSDAGEPSGSAGKPMLNALKKHQMTNIVAVVTRYFGGVKLGIRGLIDAYALAVDEAISLQTLQKQVNYEKYLITAPYEYIEKLKYDLNEFQAEISQIEYGADVELIAVIEESEVEILKGYLQEMTAKKKITYKYISL
ncbi:MAG: YigZ family protein [Candidatus Cloacimonetes bacterium]|nr:YigZ family protein [Candidatus Cloacimonadota bacterium]